MTPVSESSPASVIQALAEVLPPPNGLPVLMTTL